MDAMNTFDRTPTPSEYRPILRVRPDDPTERPQPVECECPELCQLDHGN